MHPDFSGKTLLITGGTGSFGNGAVARLLRPASEKSAFSPGMKKAGRHAQSLPNPPPRLLGKAPVLLGRRAGAGFPSGPMEGADYVIHAAALKQVPSCEFFPRPSEPTYWAQNMC